MVMAKARLFEFNPGQSIGDVKAEYQDKVYGYMADYLQGDRTVVINRNLFHRAINDGFTFAFVAGWADAGASSPITPEAQGWLNGRISTEISFSDELFRQLKELRDADLPLADKLASAQAHAAAYTPTLDGLYAQGGLMAQPEIDLTFDGEDGSHDSICQSIGGTCVRLKGQTHPARWWIENDLVPTRGNSNYDCGGWNCRHRLVDKHGKVWAQANG